MKNFNFKSRKGFTLIELLVVIGILAVLAAIAIPSVAGLIDRANVSADDTNANEMTNAIERFTSEYELVCQDIASGRFNLDNLDSAQSRVYNSTGITDRDSIKALEGDGLSSKQINRDTKYPENVATTKAIIENYTKTSSATYEPKQSDMHFYYSPDCGVVVFDEQSTSVTVTDTTLIDSLNSQILSGKDAKGKSLNEDTKWFNLTIASDSLDIPNVTTNYTLEEIENNPLLFAIGKTQPQNVIAEFNDDYSKVTITKNGEGSDGIMTDWFIMEKDTGNFASAAVSPMVEHARTLSSVIIQEGVVNIGSGAILGVDLNTGEEITVNLNELRIPKSVKTIPPMSIYYINKIDNLYYAGTANDWASISFSKMVTNEGPQPTYADLHVDIDWFSILYYTNNAYFNNKLLTEISFENGIEKIEAFSFAGYKHLTSVTIPNSVKEIQTYAFAECSNLRTLNIPDGINIWQKTFASTPLVEQVTTGAGGTYVGNYLIKASLYQSSRSLSVREGTTTIAMDAGLNGSTQILPDGTSIPTLTWLYLPSTITYIPQSSFSDHPSSLVVYGPAASYIETWTNENGFTFSAR